MAVEQRDDDDGHDVVCDGQGLQEDGEAAGDALAHQGEDADGEGDVGCHGDAEALDVLAAEVEAHVDDDGHEHAAACGDDGQQGRLDVLELAHEELVLDLHAHNEEEQGHEDFVDPVLHRHADEEVVEAKTVERDAQLEVEEGLVGFEGVGVGKDDGDDGCDHHHDGAEGLHRADLLDEGAALGVAFGLDVDEVVVVLVAH